MLTFEAVGVRIRPFHSSDQIAAQNLILAGLEEHWGFLDPTLNPDLDDIIGVYGQETFLVAEAGSHIVGTGALIHQTEGVACIVRMSVDKNMRRKGIGRKILSALCDAAKQQGYRQIVLETTSTWGDAIAFYQQYGFQIVETQEGDTHFLLNIDNGINAQL